MFDVLFVNRKILRRYNLKDYHLNLIYVKLWLRGNSEAVVRSGIVLRDSRGSLLMLYQMDGRTMHGVGSIKEYFCMYF
ncbi:hypothetical protein NC651_028992 [Populus alba x Populus x berolinensis]|nr:hypothetical protein NC651_028992 [Populus alba x Populus x berolinensis]